MSQERTVWREFKWIWLIFAFVGLFAGLGAYTFYVSRAWSYAGDAPETCVNCHVMAPYYQSWKTSSHNVWANCNDCHVPQDLALRKWGFKAVDGLYHAAAFSLGREPDVITPRESSREVMLENCLRCHTPLVTEFVGMSADYDPIRSGDRLACWDCHYDAFHGRTAAASISYGSLPLPRSPVPAWLDRLVGPRRD